MSTDENNKTNYNFECPICLHWLNEPVLTTCGHRFCKACIQSWLDSESQSCPLDNKILSKDTDLFPDNFTRREISQLKIHCPNSKYGCDLIDSPLEMDKHFPSCQYKKDSLLMHNEADENIIKAIFERIVILEQTCREQEAKIENLTRTISNSKNLIDPRYANGVMVWEIDNFENSIDQMKTNLNTRFYSRECYTSSYGYKFCARINVPPQKDFLSLHLHLMQSENDFHLDWPFNGRIKISMIHPRNPTISQSDTIMSKPEILAFHRPTENISPRGFGFVEYANISEIFRNGFVSNDKLVIKIQVNIV